MHLKPKSCSYGALQPKPWVALKNLMDHFVPYNPLNKLSVHHTSVGSIFFELHQENWIFVKIRKNFSCACHSERKNYVTPKILTPQSFDGQIICSVDCREQNGILRYHEAHRTMTKLHNIVIWPTFNAVMFQGYQIFFFQYKNYRLSN